MASHVLLLAIRLALGWYLMLAGWEKVQEELATGFGTFQQGNSFQRRHPAWLPGAIAIGFGYVLPWAELSIGALLMAGLFHRIAALASTAIFASIGVALFSTGELLPRHHIMVFLPVALLLFARGPGRFSVDEIVMGRLRGSRPHGRR